MSEQVTYPEIVPVLTDERVCFELRGEPGADGVTYRWRAVPAPGDRLAVKVSPLDYLTLRPIRKIADPHESNEAVLEAAKVEVFFRGRATGGFSAIPVYHQQTLAAVVVSMSATGADPFFVAPAASQP